MATTEPKKKRFRLPENFKLDRAKAGTVLAITGAVVDRLIEGEDVSEAVQQELSERAVARYEPHLRAAFQRYGVPLEPGQGVTVEVLLNAIKYKTGFEVLELTEQGLKTAVDKAVSLRLSAVLGVELDTVLDFEKIKTALVKSAIEAVKSGRATRLISKTIIRRIQASATWKAGGVAVGSRPVLLNREYQRRYRLKNKQVWVKE